MQLPELVRRQLPEGAVRAHSVVIVALCLNAFARVVKASERVLIQTFFAQVPVEALDVRILDWLSRTDELKPHAVLVGPGVQRLADELWPVTDLNDRRTLDRPELHKHSTSSITGVATTG